MRDEAAPNTPAVHEFGHAGWFALLAFVVGLLVRLLKTNALDAALARFGIPPIPKKALPWVALVLGFVGAAIESKMRGTTWEAAAIAGVWGLFSGGFAIAGNEALPTITRPISAPATNVVFGPAAGPDPGPAAPNPSVRPPPPPGGAGGTGGAGGGSSPASQPAILMRVFAFAAALMVVPVLAGCAALAPYLPMVIADVTRAILTLDTIEQFMAQRFKEAPNPALEAKLGKGLARCRAALNAAQSAARGTDELNKAQTDKAWDEFQRAYEELLVIVGPFGVKPAAGDGLAVSEDGATLSVPLPADLRTPR